MKQPKAFCRQCGPSWNISDGLGKKESALRGIQGTALQAQGSRSVWKPSGHLTGSGLMGMRDHEKRTEGKGCRSILGVKRLTEVSGQEAGCWGGGGRDSQCSVVEVRRSWRRKKGTLGEVTSVLAKQLGYS